jgi:hypothetical protein
MNRFSALAASGLSIALAATIVGCSSQQPKKPESQSQPAATQSQPAETKEEVKTLKGWEGTWNNFVNYLDDKELDAAYAEKAKADNKKPEDIKKELKERRKAEFGGLEIHGDTITFLDGFKDKGGKEITKATYKFKSAKKVQHGGKELEWDVFEAQEKDAKYPVLMLMPVHGEEELVHFHMRYGKSLDELEKQDKWYPTFVKPESTMDQIADEVKE